jgi:hypothetical protein
VKKRAVRKYTHRGVTPPPKLAPYAAYSMGASSLRRRLRSSMRQTPGASSPPTNSSRTPWRRSVH